MFARIINYALRLTILCAAAAFGLAAVYGRTRPMIEEQTRKIEDQARKEVLPEAGRFEEVSADYSVAYNEDDSHAGKVVKSSRQGYGGQIKVMTGIDDKGRVAGVKILEHFETPGLGDGVTKESFTRQFVGKALSEIKLKKDGAGIDAVTGATISSSACIEAVRKGLELVEEYEQANR